MLFMLTTVFISKVNLSLAKNACIHLERLCVPCIEGEEEFNNRSVQVQLYQSVCYANPYQYLFSYNLASCLNLMLLSSARFDINPH